MKGQEGLKPHVGNSMGLCNIHVETPQKPESEAQTVTVSGMRWKR